jgi:sugar phosphate isomerase/epimerase
VPLVFWDGCVFEQDVFGRAEAMLAGGFSSMSVLSRDLVQLERAGDSVAQLARELREREVRVSVIDAYLGWYPGLDSNPISGPYADLVDISADAVLRYAETLEAESITVGGPFDGRAPAPLEAVIEGLGAFAERAATVGVRLHLELIPTTTVPDLRTALLIVNGVDRDNAGLVLDTFHLGRSACRPEDLDAVPLEKVFQIQLCDGPLVATVSDYFEEALTSRVFAGEGELPVRAYAEHLIRDGHFPAVGPEVFLPQLNSMAPAEAGRLCGENTRAFLASLHPAVITSPSRAAAR